LLCSALLLVAFVLVGRAADKEPADEPLPPGAKVRLGQIGMVGRVGVSDLQLLAPDFNTFLVGGFGEGGPRIGDLRTGSTALIPGFVGSRLDRRPILGVSADGKRALIERANPGGVAALLVFEATTGKIVRTIEKPAGAGPDAYLVGSASISANGKVVSFVTTRSMNGKDHKSEVYVWDVEKNEQLARVVPPQTTATWAVLSPDGKNLATYGATSGAPPKEEDDRAGAVRVWNAETGDLITTLLEPSPGMTQRALAFSPDGKTLALSGTFTSTIGLWDATTGKQTDTLLGRAQQGRALAFAPDGKTLAALAQNGTIDRWALPEGKPLKPTHFPRPEHVPYAYLYPQRLVFTDNDRIIAWGMFGTHPVAWEVPSGKLFVPLAPGADAFTAVQFSADGKEIITSNGHVCMRWEVPSAKPEGSAVTGKALGTVGPAVRDPFPVRLAPGAVRGLRGANIVYDFRASEELFVLPFPQAFPSADFTLAAGFVPPRKPGPVRLEVWNTDTRRRVAAGELPQTDGTPEAAAAAFSPDSARLVTVVNVRRTDASSAPLLVTGWDLKTGTKLGEFSDTVGGPVQVAAVSNSRAVLATRDGRLWLADFEKGAAGDVIDEAPPRAKREQRITLPTLSPNEKFLAAVVPSADGSVSTVRVYGMPWGKVLHTFAGHRGTVAALVFSPDGKTLASVASDTTVLLWDLTVIAEPK
jgi:WD40 repeat protein